MPPLRKEHMDSLKREGHRGDVCGIGSILVLAAAGNIILDSASDEPRNSNFADRKYFTIHRDHPDAPGSVAIANSGRATSIADASSRRVGIPFSIQLDAFALGEPPRYIRYSDLLQNVKGGLFVPCNPCISGERQMIFTHAIVGMRRRLP